MGLFTNNSAIGMSPRPYRLHQRLIARMLCNIRAELISKEYDVLPESTVTADCNDLAPDIVILNEQDGYPIFIAELANHKGLRKDIRKCEQLMARFPDAEYFVYDYEKEVLYSADVEAGEWKTSDEYELSSRYLERPVLEYLAYDFGFNQ